MLLAGTKTWEMRGRRTSVRGRVYLARQGSGLLVATASVEGCGEPLDHEGMLATRAMHGIPPDKVDGAVAAGWVVPWHLSGILPLPEPLPYRHPRGAVTWVRLD